MTDRGEATEEAYLGQGVARSHGRQSESETYDLRHHGGFGWVVGVGVLWVEDIFYQVCDMSKKLCDTELRCGTNSGPATGYLGAYPILRVISTEIH